MSDVMLLGVLRMPLPEEPDQVTLAQFQARACEAADRIERDAAEIERLREALERIEREGAGLWLAQIAAVALRGEEG